MSRHIFCPDCGGALEHDVDDHNWCGNCGRSWVIRDQNSGAGDAANEECLTRLMEECGEVVKVSSKIKRFGLFNYHPNDRSKTTNMEILELELADLLLAIDTVVAEMGLSVPEIAQLYHEKRATIAKWLTHIDIHSKHSFIHACMKDLVRTTNIEETFTEKATDENLPGYSI